MSFQGPKLEPTSSSAAAASSESITRSNSSPQMSLHQSTEPTPQSSEPHVSLSQMKNLIANMFQEFQTTTLPQQIATAVQNAMRNSQGQSQSFPSVTKYVFRIACTVRVCTENINLSALFSAFCFCFVSLRFRFRILFSSYIRFRLFTSIGFDS